MNRTIGALGIIVGLSVVVVAIQTGARNQTARGQDAGLDERIRQLESRVAALEASRGSGGSGAIPSPSPASSTALELEGYRGHFNALTAEFDNAQSRLSALIHPSISNQEVSFILGSSVANYGSLIAGIRSATPPPCYAATHTVLLLAAAAFQEYVPAVSRGEFTTEARTAYTVGSMFYAEARRLFGEAKCPM